MFDPENCNAGIELKGKWKIAQCSSSYFAGMKTVVALPMIPNFLPTSNEQEDSFSMEEKNSLGSLTTQGQKNVVSEISDSTKSTCFYFEFELLAVHGAAYFGIVTDKFKLNHPIGDCAESWAIDNFLGSVGTNKQWRAYRREKLRAGDVVGILVRWHKQQTNTTNTNTTDISKQTNTTNTNTTNSTNEYTGSVEFSINGRSLGPAFQNALSPNSRKYFPAISMKGSGTRVRLIVSNFLFPPQNQTSFNSITCSIKAQDLLKNSIANANEKYNHQNSFIHLRFPNEILQRIFAFLDVRSLCMITAVCRLFARLSVDQRVWASVYSLLEQKPIPKLIRDEPETSLKEGKQELITANQKEEAEEKKETVELSMYFDREVKPLSTRLGQTSISTDSSPSISKPQLAPFVDYREKCKSLWNFKQARYRLFSEFFTEMDLAALAQTEKLLFAAGQNESAVSVFNLQEDEENPTGYIGAFAGAHHGSVTCLRTFQSNGKEFLVSASGDLSMAIWDTQDRLLIETMKNHHDRPIRSVRFIPERNALVTAGLDKVVGFFDILTGTLVSKLAGHTKQVNEVAVINQNLIASASADTTVALWDLRSKNRVHNLTHISKSPIRSLCCVNPLQGIVSGSEDRTLQFTDLRFPTDSKQIMKLKNTATGLESDGTRMACVCQVDASVFLFSAQPQDTMKPISLINSTPINAGPFAYCMSMSDDCLRIGGRGKIKCIDFRTEGLENSNADYEFSRNVLLSRSSLQQFKLSS